MAINIERMSGILVYISIYAFILNLIKKYYGRRIKTTESIEDTILLRKRMSWVMQCVTILWVIIWFLEVLIEMCVFRDKENELDVVSFFTTYLIVVGCAVLFYLYLKKKYNVSFAVYKKEEFLSAHPSFVLYLRAFSTDDYNAKTNESLSWSTFSEDEFVRSLRGMFPVCAIGMTKEIVAPRGAMRVYVSDATWQTDVRELMERAELIVVLVDDRPSCLWEIEQSSDLLEKTAFIVVDKEKYNSARIKVVDSIILPEVTSEVFLPFCVHRLKNCACENTMAGGTDIFSFKNSLKGYDEVWDHLLEAGINKRRRKKRREGTALRWARMLLNGCCVSMLLLILVSLSGYAIINLAQGQIIKSVIAIVVVVLLLTYFFWDEIKERLRRGKDSMNK